MSFLFACLFWGIQNSLKAKQIWGDAGDSEEKGEGREANQNGRATALCFEPKLFLLEMHQAVRSSKCTKLTGSSLETLGLHYAETFSVTTQGTW